MQAIVQYYLKLMELCQLFKVKMDGIGQNTVFKEMTGRHGRNGQ